MRKRKPNWNLKPLRFELNAIVNSDKGRGTVVEYEQQDDGTNPPPTRIVICLDDGFHRRCGGRSKYVDVNPASVEVIGQFVPGRASGWDLNAFNRELLRDTR